MMGEQMYDKYIIVFEVLSTYAMDWLDRLNSWYNGKQWKANVCNDPSVK